MLSTKKNHKRIKTKIKPKKKIKPKNEKTKMSPVACTEQGIKKNKQKLSDKQTQRTMN